MSTKSKEIFISHAVADKDIAAELVRLLASGLNITGEKVFCSSLPGRSIPGGFNFVNHIKNALSEAKVVLLLITENYFNSQFCLAEIGACWISKDCVVPIIVPPVGYEKLKATLSLQQAWRIDNDDDLNSLADDICKPLKLEVKYAQWGVEKGVFLRNVDTLIKEQDFSEFILPDEYEKRKKELEYCTDELQKLQDQLKEKDQTIEEIKKLKDKSEIQKFEISQMSEWEEFELLCKDVKKALANIPSIVSKALFYEKKGKTLPTRWTNYQIEDEIERASDSNMLICVEDEPVWTNHEHPKVSDAKDLLDELEEFMSENSDKLRPIIEDKYQISYDLADKDFWSKFLGGI